MDTLLFIIGALCAGINLANFIEFPEIRPISGIFTIVGIVNMVLAFYNHS